VKNHRCANFVLEFCRQRTKISKGGQERRKQRTKISKGLVSTHLGEKLHFEGLSLIVKVDSVLPLR